ncbi:hypothetical protein ART_2361 [Arthrobacter sp. PAMC 25486]|uniref:hypothetical protein n=1 Tax=Arthrobacter sp. PAMC 25486 TaxID=1494608 RepID=UPI000535ABC2|nr:hypothetical protein [Arthrobacter sp. PAMC 25486]AIY01960.1 hypothetical protein ART_2361 [Arthrobacter sp. PAMC 25486]
MSTPTTPQVPPHGADDSVDPAVAGRAAFPELPSVPVVPVKSRKHIYFGLGGLVVGLAAGLALGAFVGAVSGALSESGAIPRAVEVCSATDMEGVSVMDGGKSLNLQTAGEESEGTTALTVVCVLGELDAPDSLYTKLESTRALDGNKSADWAGFTASWTYHPDDGLNIIVETAAK